MSTRSQGNVSSWQCPECGRSYRIPVGSETPTICKQCTRRNQRAENRDRQSKEATADRTAPLATQSVEPSGRNGQLEDLKREAAAASLPPEVEAHLARLEREKLVAEVASMSRSLKSFKKIVWALLLMLLLNVVVSGVALYFGMQQLSSLDGMLGGLEGEVGPGLDGKQPAGNLKGIVKPVKDYADLLNELTKPQ